MARARASRRYRWAWLTVGGMFVALVAALAIGFALRDDVVRYVFMQRLASDDPNTRLQGAAYLCRHADTDAVVLAAAIDRLDRAQRGGEAEVADAIIRGLNCAAVWGADCGDVWVRHLDDRLDAGGIAARVGVALQLARAGLGGQPVAQRPLAAGVIARLLDDPNGVVRYHGLRAAAACDNAQRVKLIRGATHDDEPTIRKHAWIMLGLAGADVQRITARTVTTLEAPAMGAMFWADPIFAAGVMNGSTDDGRMHPVWVYPLRGTSAAPWGSWLAVAPARADAGRRATFWRAALGAPLDAQARRLLVEAVDQMADAGEPVDALAAAAVSRVADHVTPMRWTGREGYRLRELAWLESVAPRSIDMTITDELPDLVRALALRAAKGVSLDEAVLAFDSDLAAVRHLAVLHAAERFDDATLDQLIDRLVVTFYDNRIMGGAILAGYTGRSADLLADRLKREEGWRVRLHLKLGLFMQGRPADLRLKPLLRQPEAPRLTLLWAMMHVGRIDALDALIAPLGGDDGALREALDADRFIGVLRRYLPAVRERAPFWVWADPALQRFQLDVLRDWYLLHRSSLVWDSSSRTYVRRGD